MSEFRPALVVFGLLSLLTGVLYPLIVTGVGQVAFPRQANGSLIRSGEQVLEPWILLEPSLSNKSAALQRRGFVWFQSRANQSCPGIRRSRPCRGAACG